ncbi:hypothetical protein NL676_027296 [Syzygium grande]|nr:hypothetical protein NL676_027296 [Syzygium grande]
MVVTVMVVLARGLDFSHPSLKLTEAAPVYVRAYLCEGCSSAQQRRKKVAADPAPEGERSAALWKRSGGTYARVHDRVFNSDEYDHRRASFQAVIPAFSPAPFMF